MSVIGSNILAGASGQGGGYNLERSLRFRSSASAYLSRNNVSSPTDSKKWTWSAWVKRGNFGYKKLLSAEISGTDDSYLQFYDDQLSLGSYSGSGTDYGIRTVAVFRDPSAWYHIVAVLDTANATSADRAIIYVNGVRQTVNNQGNGMFPLNSTNCKLNTGSVNVNIGRIQNGSSTVQFDGYMTEMNFIDGQALTPSSFGETNAQTGVWQPKRYAGTYGTNGFYLPFTDNSALTSGSNAGLGKDFSGNGNYWNTNNISITSGSTYDSMTDVPTLTSATASNFALCNPIAKTSNVTLSDANLTAAFGSVSGGGGVIATMACPTSGKFYWEATVTAASSASIHIGVLPSSLPTFSGTQYYEAGLVPDSYAYQNDGTKYSNNTNTSYGASYTTNDVIGVALDMDAGTITFYKNNTSQGTAFSSLSGSYIPAFGDGSSAGTHTLAINFGQRPFAYTPPTGFVALNTFNLPTPTIGATASTQANKNMDISLYTANETARNITNSGFQPDLVWIKGRSAAWSHALFDSVRGAGRWLRSSDTNAEPSQDLNTLSSFNSDGFGLGNNSSGTAVNFATGQTFVAWQWKANGTGVSNTAGSITSTVSANTSAGFSVVTYTGTGADATVGHGLGVAPRMIITKRRNDTSQWCVYHGSLANTQALYLNLTNAVATEPEFWNSTTPTSTVFSLGNDSAVNPNGGTMVAYCFASVAGYSAIGSYTGTGSSSSLPFIYTGFRPKFILMKNASASGQYWEIYDTSRDTYNASGLRLFPNASDAENDARPEIDILSNGFKIVDNQTSNNGSGNTIIYYAVAENPFKYSLGR